jgi:hypothetical protein
MFLEHIYTCFLNLQIPFSSTSMDNLQIETPFFCIQIYSEGKTCLVTRECCTSLSIEIKYKRSARDCIVISVRIDGCVLKRRRTHTLDALTHAGIESSPAS